ncbi:lactate racemase domain-containing protein [Maioricimonas sp. JC845]|uniref:lactate racemase domain-containing protein n=1 Tax=Maioricimonas sp. JC845 TaxID=3232138 RepID=UPI0034576F64
MTDSSFIGPRMVTVRQQFERTRIEDVAGEVDRQLTRLQLQERIGPGESVAVTVGSRGIAGIATITRAIVDHLKSISAAPFLVPAMGSHGGGTVEGQLGVLRGYGITEEAMGVPIRASMETVIVDRTPQGIPVHFDRCAYEADHVLVANRIKPHTGFVGEIESGLHKMMLIGLGKQAGAVTYHRAIKDHTFPEIISAVAEVVLKRCKVVGGLAIVENAYDETALIEAVAPPQFREREEELLLQARRWLPRLPVREVDLLIIDRIGKNISGTGMDTNVVGRKYNDHAATSQDDVSCKRIFVRGLSAGTHGNATGIGLAEFTTRNVVAQIDEHSTKMNCITSGHPTAGMIPLVYDSDREVIESALQTIGLVEPHRSRVVQISDTLHLAELHVSEACLEQGELPAGLEVIGDPVPMTFDERGNLPDVASPAASD